MKARIKFQKSGVMKYVGHLDIMRYFQKAMRRSGLPIKYSGGFNPHQIMSFASPLGVGITSMGEYLDIELTEQIPSAEGLKRLSAVMVEGMSVTGFRYLNDKEKNAMASVEAASYELRYRNPEAFPYTLQQLLQAREDFFENQSVIPLTKKTKRGERELNLKPLIYQFKITEDARDICFHLTVSAGSTENIKPEVVLAQFFRFMGQETPEHAFAIHRTDMFTKSGDGLVSLGEIGYEV